VKGVGRYWEGKGRGSVGEELVGNAADSETWESGAGDSEESEPKILIISMSIRMEIASICIRTSHFLGYYFIGIYVATQWYTHDYPWVGAHPRLPTYILNST
jgi:hypothetical protein